MTGCAIAVAGPVTRGGRSQATLLPCPEASPEQVKVAGKRAGWSRPSIPPCCDPPSWSRPGCKHGVRRSPAEPWGCSVAGRASLPLPLLWLPPLANPSDCQEQDFSIPMRSDRSESPRSGFSFKLTGQWTLNSLSWPPSQCKERPQPPESRGGPAEWDGEMGSFLGDNASEGVREDEMQFQLPAAFPDRWGVRVPTGPSQKRTTNPALKCI